jgi:hypothetical protein
VRFGDWGGNNQTKDKYELSIFGYFNAQNAKTKKPNKLKFGLTHKKNTNGLFNLF